MNKSMEMFINMGLLSAPEVFKSNPTKTDPLPAELGKNRKCEGCGHKNKKCSCGLYKSKIEKRGARP
jgi:hypothetical protein